MIANPKDVATKYIGEPRFTRGRAYWYNSPFRNDDNPSFEVDDIGFYDFATDERYDVFDFISKLLNVSFIEACKTIATLYGIIDDEPMTTAKLRELEAERLAHKQYVENVNKWYIELFNFVEYLNDTNNEYLEVLDYTSQVYQELLTRKIFLGQLREELLATNSLEEKENMRKQMKVNIPLWMKQELRNYIMTLENWDTRPMAKLDCLADLMN